MRRHSKNHRGFWQRGTHEKQRGARCFDVVAAAGASLTRLWSGEVCVTARMRVPVHRRAFPRSSRAMAGRRLIAVELADDADDRTYRDQQRQNEREAASPHNFSSIYRRLARGSRVPEAVQRTCHGR